MCFTCRKNFKIRTEKPGVLKIKKWEKTLEIDIISRM